jgi:hypothetical protein
MSRTAELINGEARRGEAMREDVSFYAAFFCGLAACCGV